LHSIEQKDKYLFIESIIAYSLKFVNGVRPGIMLDAGCWILDTGLVVGGR